MYYIGGTVMVIYLLLGVLSRKENVDGKTGKLFAPFYKMAAWIYKRACIHKLPLFSSGQVERDLRSLYPEEGKEQLKTDYYIRKISLSLGILFVGTLFGALVKYNSQSNVILDEDGRITRGRYKEGKKEVMLKNENEGRESRFLIEVFPLQLSESQINVLFDEFLSSLPEYILGENPSFDQISSDLTLEESYGDFPFLTEWESSDPSIVGNTGRVYPREGPVSVELTVKMTYDKIVREEKLELCVVPEVQSPEEQERAELEELLLQSEYKSRDEEVWTLPREWQGETVNWRQEVEDHSLLLWLTVIVTTVSVYVMSDQDLHKQLQRRKKMMQKDYPDIVHKLVLYVGAGLTTRGAFQKIAGDYEKRRKKEPRPAYEEILYACRELHSGVSEGVVYEHFGKRTGLQEYIRLGTLLTQNLKKGNSALLQRLREEADRAGEERLQNCKRLGEEAGTKLLVPMVLMLVVVMIIIMIPAFSSM